MFSEEIEIVITLLQNVSNSEVGGGHGSVGVCGNGGCGACGGDGGGGGGDGGDNDHQS